MSDDRQLPAGLLHNGDWQAHGACCTQPINTFFTPAFERSASRARREADAKAVCAHCPVLAQCRTHALTTREPCGIWGGLTELERLTLRPARRHPQPINSATPRWPVPEGDPTVTEPGCADVAERLFAEFDARLGLSTVSSVVLHQRRLLLGRTPVVGAPELERCARHVLQILLEDSAAAVAVHGSPLPEPQVADSAVTR